MRDPPHPPASHQVCLYIRKVSKRKEYVTKSSPSKFISKGLITPEHKSENKVEI